MGSVLLLELTVLTVTDHVYYSPVGVDSNICH